MNRAELDLTILPYIVQDFAHLIGLPLTMRIVEQYGGTRLYIPKGELADDHSLVKLVGREAAEKLQKQYGGDAHQDIPLALAATRAVRNAEMRRKRKHASASQLAREYNTTERNIRMICGEVTDDRQGGLF
jgi:Mor family transcriptional regulator